MQLWNSHKSCGSILKSTEKVTDEARNKITPLNKRDGQKRVARGDCASWLHSLQLSQEDRMKHPTDTWSKLTGSDMHSAIPCIRWSFCKSSLGALRHSKPHVPKHGGRKRL